MAKRNNKLIKLYVPHMISLRIIYSNLEKINALYKFRSIKNNPSGSRRDGRTPVSPPPPGKRNSSRNVERKVHAE